MTDYNSGDWFGWNGGECPVHPETLVEGIYLDPETNDVNHWSPVTDPASEFDWERVERFLLVAFRVVKEYREPREFWLVETDGAPRVFTSKDRAELYAEEYGFAAVLFREVIE